MDRYLSFSLRAALALPLLCSPLPFSNYIPVTKMNKLINLTSKGYHLDIIWASLMAMTLLTAAIAEKAPPSLTITIVISVIIIIKARLVIDYFMELKGASPYIYHLMNLYFYLFPILAILVWLFPEKLADLTRLSH